MNNLEIMIRICEMYYLEGITKQEIGNRLRISRFAVTRLLDEAVDKGIITFNIAKPTVYNHKLAHLIEKKYKLYKVIVVNGGTTAEDIKPALGVAGAELLGNILRSGDVIGVSAGESVNSVVNSFHSSQQLDNLTVVQLVGSFIQNTENGSPDASKNLASKLNAELALLNVPAVLDLPNVKEALLDDSNIKPTIDLFDQISVALLGIGSLTHNSSSNLLRNGYISQDEQCKLIQDGAVGDILAQFFTEQGDICTSPLSDRIIAMQAEILSKVPYTIGIAGGVNKVKAVKGAIHAGLIKMLVIDEVAAERLLEE